MAKWTKEAAVTALVNAANEINSLGQEHPFSSAHTRWITNVLRVLEQVFGMRSRYYLTFSAYTWRFHGSTVVMSWELRGSHPDEAMRRRHQAAFLEQLASAHGLIAAAVDELQATSDIDSVYEGKDTPAEASSIVRVINIAERKLRKVIHDTPESEKKLQDSFEALLVASDITYSREKVAFEYSSRAYRPDFVLETIDLAIELKLCNSKDKEKAIVQEINDDILAYKTKFGNLLFVVYDLGCIRDVDRFAGQFEKNENVVVRVIKS